MPERRDLGTLQHLPDVAKNTTEGITHEDESQWYQASLVLRRATFY
jgi:hypothetical protein